MSDNAKAAIDALRRLGWQVRLSGGEARAYSAVRVGRHISSRLGGPAWPRRNLAQTLNLT